MAEIIVELVKNGVKIVVNSHSPYMIQALIKYARDENIVDKSNFYLTKKVDNYAIINNVNDELNKIFELLAKPMNEVFEL
jgi:predicted ATPase